MSELILIASASCLITGAISLWVCLQKPENTGAKKHTQQKFEPDIIGDRFRILTADELIKRLELEPTINNLRANLGLADENWQKDALPFIQNFIEFVQRIPASENHHHAGDGGLIRHTLDVAILALNLSNAKSWPPDAPTEDIARLTAVWRFGIFIAAMLHDVGKTITGVEVSLYTSATDKSAPLWFPEANSMLSSGAKFYSLRFPEVMPAKDKHGELAWIFFKNLLPDEVRAWIVNSDPNLVKALRSYLSADKQHVAPFAQIISKADSESTRRDLKAGSRQRFASSKRRPLIEVIIDSLQDMLAEPGRYFSIAKTSGGDLFRQGDYVYMVCANVPNQIREYLKQQSASLLASFPTNNEKIFGVLLESGAVEACSFNPERTVIPAQVSFVKSDGKTTTVLLTMLCFKLKTLFKNEALYPAEFQGTLIVYDSLQDVPKKELAQAEERDKQLEAAAIQIAETGAIPVNESVTADKQIETGANAVHVENQAHQIPEPPRKRPAKKKEDIDDILSSINSKADISVNVIDRDAIKNDAKNEAKLVEPSSKPQNMKKTADRQSKLKVKLNNMLGQSNKELLKTRLDDSEEDTEELVQSLAENTESSELIQAIVDDIETLPSSAKEEMQNNFDAMSNSAPRPVMVFNPENLKIIPTQKSGNNAQEYVENMLHENGNKFINWLAEGLACGRIAYNNAAAPVHFIKQGMLLVTPKIFADFAGGVFDKADKNSPGVLAQRGFQSLKLHKEHKHKRGLSAHWTVSNSDEDNKALFRAYLVPEEKLHLIIQITSRPANNLRVAITELNVGEK